MVVGVLTLNIQLPGCKSLKEKRSRLKPLINRLQREFNISVTELGQQDAWDSSTLGCAWISSDQPFVQKSLQVIVHWLEKNWPDVTLVDDHIEIITYEGNMDLQLKNKRALVAGSSKGLGYAIALALASEGCRVAINGRNKENLLAAAKKLDAQAKAEVLPLVGDVGLPEVPAAMIQQVVGTFGGLDLLVTNAGGPPSGKFDMLDDPTWQHAVELSLLSHVRLIRAALPYLRQSDCASVVTMTSYSVKQPIPNLVLSNSIRAATVGLTKTLALELGKDGVRFNSILPGWTNTERVHEIMAFRAKSNGTSIDEEIQHQVADTVLGRMAQPEEIANAVVFLLSPAAAYITGVMLSIDGGSYKGTL